MSLQTDMAGDMAEMVHTDVFGETITYTPSGGSAKSIAALVDRTPLRPTEHGGQTVPQNMTEIWIINNATTGVASVKPGFDTVALKAKLSDAATTTMRVTKLLYHDAGTWRLEVMP
jgi:hypothetical protein